MEWLTMKEYAEKTGWSLSRVKVAVRAGEVETRRVTGGRCILINASSRIADRRTRSGVYIGWRKRIKSPGKLSKKEACSQAGSQRMVQNDPEPL